jgi:hypothetical protein
MLYPTELRARKVRPSVYLILTLSGDGPVTTPSLETTRVGNEIAI